MQIVNIHQAKTHLSRLVEQASKGDSFVIAKAGKPMVRVVPMEKSKSPKKRLGFLKGKMVIPKDFDSMGQDAIATLFMTVNETPSRHPPPALGRWDSPAPDSKYSHAFARP